MHFLTAEKIHNDQGRLPDNSVIEVADEGTVISVSNEPNKDAVFFALPDVFSHLEAWIKPVYDSIHSSEAHKFLIKPINKKNYYPYKP